MIDSPAGHQVNAKAAGSVNFNATHERGLPMKAGRLLHCPCKESSRRVCWLAHSSRIAGEVRHSVASAVLLPLICTADVFLDHPGRAACRLYRSLWHACMGGIACRSTCECSCRVTAQVREACVMGGLEDGGTCMWHDALLLPTGGGGLSH